MVTTPTNSSTAKSRPRVPLAVLLLAGAALGFAIGGVWGEHWIAGDWPVFTGLLKLLGDLFMNMLKMVVVPLIVCSMIVGMAALAEHRSVGKTFAFTFTYYLATTLISVSIGLMLVSIVQPGTVSGLAGDGAMKVDKVVTWYEALFDMLRGLVPPNLFEAAAEGRILGLLAFSLVFGGILVRMGKAGEQVVALISTVNDALMTLVRVIVWLAPVGVMGLVADRIGQAGGGNAVWTELARLGTYFLTVLAGLSLHAFVVLPILLLVFARRRPLLHARHFADAMLTAFSTASSAASLPVTIRNAEDEAGISPRASRFVLPLGATVNMDGTALYEAVAAVFIAQAYGIDLSGAQLVIVLLTATLAAVGAAAIPQAGLVTMVMVLAAVNVPVEGIGILLSVDWLLDRFRTTVNVWGDSVGCAIVDRRLELEDRKNMERG